jgi:uncharacterized membrane protein
MIDDLITAATVAAAVGCALVAGLMFAFSTSVTSALDRRRNADGIATMQAMNSTILQPHRGREWPERGGRIGDARAASGRT